MSEQELKGALRNKLGETFTFRQVAEDAVTLSVNGKLLATIRPDEIEYDPAFLGLKGPGFDRLIAEAWHEVAAAVATIDEFTEAVMEKAKRQQRMMQPQA